MGNNNVINSRENTTARIIRESLNSPLFKVMLIAFTTMALIKLAGVFSPVGGAEDLYAQLSSSMPDAISDAQIETLAKGVSMLTVVMAIIAFLPYVLGTAGIWKIFMARMQKDMVTDGYKLVKFYLIGNIIAMFLSSASMVILLIISAKMTNEGDAGSYIVRFAGYLFMLFAVMTLYYVKGIDALRIFQNAATQGQVTGVISLIVIAISLVSAATALSGIMDSIRAGAVNLLSALSSISDVAFHGCLAIFLYKLKGQLSST